MTYRVVVTGSTWLSQALHGCCVIYMATTGSTWLLRGLLPPLFRKKKIALRGSFGKDLREGVTVALSYLQSLYSSFSLFPIVHLLSLLIITFPFPSIFLSISHVSYLPPLSFPVCLSPISFVFLFLFPYISGLYPLPRGPFNQTQFPSAKGRLPHRFMMITELIFAAIRCEPPSNVRCTF